MSPQGWDFFRLVIILLFGLGIGETALIIRQYGRIMKNSRRLLPKHVALVSVAVLGLQFEAVWHHLERAGHSPDWLLPFNLVLFSFVYASLLYLRMHLNRKVKVQQEFLPLVQDAKEFD